MTAYGNIRCSQVARGGDERGVKLGDTNANSADLLFGCSKALLLLRKL